MDAQQNNNLTAPLPDEEFKRKDFQYNRFGIELSINDSAEKWKESLNALSQKILNCKTVTSDEEKQKLHSMFLDYMRLAKTPKAKKAKCKEITPRDLIDTENSVILSRVYFLAKRTADEHFTKSANNAINTTTFGLLGASVILGISSIIAKASFTAPMVCLASSFGSYAASLYYNMYKDIKSEQYEKKCIFEISALRKYILSNLNAVIDHCNKKTFKMTKEYTSKLLCAKNNIEKQRLSEKYNNILSAQKKKRSKAEAEITETNNDLYQIAKNLPDPLIFCHFSVMKEGCLEKAKEDYQSKLNNWKSNNGSKNDKKQIEQDYKNKRKELEAKYDVKSAMLEYAVRKFYMQNPGKNYIYPLVPDNVIVDIRNNMNAINNNRRRVVFQQPVRNTTVKFKRPPIQKKPFERSNA